MLAIVDDDTITFNNSNLGIALLIHSYVHFALSSGHRFFILSRSSSKKSNDFIDTFIRKNNSEYKLAILCEPTAKIIEK